MQKKLTALIVDDEVKAVALLQKLLEDTLQFSRIDLAYSATEAFQKIDLAEPDLLFLDIKMPTKDGFSFLRDIQDLKINSAVVFVTAYDKFSLQAIKSHAFDYLLKPVDRKELIDCINQFRTRIQEPNLIDRLSKFVSSYEETPKLRINTRTGYILIDPVNILYCKADGNYTFIDLGDRQHLCSIQLGTFESMLPKNGFIRLGRSLIINFDFISKVDRKTNLITFEKDTKVYTQTITKSQLKELEVKQAR
ncbi:MAG: response regulator transcription factor [Bacteroidia bacterium]|nr:response regulator transcription factor [Bacteroidia bacterium]